MTRFSSVLFVLWSCFLSQGTLLSSSDSANEAVATLYRLGNVDPLGFIDSGFVSVALVSTIDGGGTLYEVHATEKAGTPTRTLPPTTVTSALTLTQHLTTVIESTLLETLTLVTLNAGETPMTTTSTGLVTTTSISFLPGTTLTTTTQTVSFPSMQLYAGNTLVSDIQVSYTISEAASRLRLFSRPEDCQLFQENGTAECALLQENSNSSPFTTTTGRLVPWYTVTPTRPIGTPTHAGASSPPNSASGRVSRASISPILCSGLISILTYVPLIRLDFI